MKRLSDTILDMAHDEDYSPIQRSQRIQAALEAAEVTLTDEITQAIAMSFYDSATGIDVAKEKIREVLSKRL